MSEIIQLPDMLSDEYRDRCIEGKLQREIGEEMVAQAGMKGAQQMLDENRKP